MASFFALLLSVVVVAGCGGRDRPLGDGGAPSDGGGVGDGAVVADAGRRDGGALDASVLPDASPGVDGAPPPVDAGRDAGSADAGPCMTHADCGDDGNACNGTSACFFGLCIDGTPPTCDDGNACTADACDPAIECTHTLVDADGDGHAPDTLGAPCDDCDDTRPSTYAGAPDEACNGVDDDCDGDVDEDGVVTSWADCDGDGYAAAGATSVTRCGVPPTPPAGCADARAGWSEWDPATYADCRDDVAEVFPLNFGWHTTPIPGEPPASDYDYNCNDVEWMRWTDVGSCMLNSDGTACVLVVGWDMAVPECGVSRLFIDTCAMSPGPGVWECRARGPMRPQECH